MPEMPPGGLSTRSVHGGEPRDNPYHSLTTPIVQTSTYRFADTAAVLQYMEERMFWDVPQREEYGRYGNPTVRVAESKLAALEECDDAVLVTSGMAAITSTLLILLSPGDHLVVTDDCYRRTRQFVHAFLHRWQVQVTVVPMGDYGALEAAITPRTRLIFSETPTNPFLRVLDLPRLVAIARRHNVRTIIDSTFATPINLRPLTLGVDLVIHSGTKYLGGHNDLLAGAMVGRSELITPLREAQGVLGAIVDPHVAYLLLRGLKTLALRMERHNANGLAVARFLERHPRVRRVYYPGLPSHPDYAVAREQMSGFGGVVSFELDVDGPAARRFVDALRIPAIGPSFGGVESLVEQPCIQSYYDLDREARLALGITDELVRLSVGIEDAQDLIADLEQALKHV
jgi:cystathionine gamma-synthase